MILWDFLDTCHYNQGLYIYRTNDREIKRINSKAPDMVK